MAVVKKALISLLVVIMVLTLASCDNGKTMKVEYNGSELSVSEINSILESSLEKNTEDIASIEVLPYKETIAEIDAADTVYFTESGTVWHTEKTCHYANQGKVLYYGTQEDAISAGKTRICSGCNKNGG